MSDPDSPDEVMDVLLVLADYMEERGEQHGADCLRWCRQHDKRPWKTRGSNPEYHWYNEEEVDRGLNTDPASDLPSELFKSLDMPLSYSWKNYDTNRTAWTALFSAWVEAVAQG